MPNPEVVEKALEQIRKRPANHDYFFSKLTSADWIEPLDEAGLFSSPPPAIREGDTISFPSWPESRYLARVASDAPEAVAAVMMKIPETDNVRVHEDLAHAAAKLPSRLAAQWAEKETAWIRQQEHLYFLLPEALGEVVAHLATSGEPKAALGLAQALLAVSLVGDSPKQARARFDAWSYAQLLQKRFPDILRHTRLDGLALLFDLLEAALAEESDGGDEDYSWIWRPAVEPHAQNLGHGDVRDALVDAIRDGSLQLTSEGLDPETIVDALLERRRPIFKRIALHVLAANPEHQAATEFALNRDNFFDERLWHEYGQLLAAIFSNLEAEKQSTILAWIENGPVREEGENDDQDLRRKRKANWQARRLSGLRGHLPQEWEQRYSEIVAELGEPEHPDFVSYTTTWTGPTSPKEVHELEAMSAREIASFLKTWEPSGGWHTPEPEGLGRVLQSVVAKSPGRFVDDLETFRDVDPTYARAIVQGLGDAVKAGRTIEWGPVIEYLDWIATRPRTEVKKPSGRLDQDPHWGWARRAVVSLLSVGFERNAISGSFREPAWRIIDIIADDPDPTREDDEKSTMDPATRSINTTRGKALHAIVRYALWVRRNLVEADAKAGRSEFDMSTIPEVRTRLEWHLNPSVEPSPAIRAVFGCWFPSLLMLDRSWAEAKVSEIFSPGAPALRDAAWHAYLAFGPASTEAFRVLRAQYGEYVDRLSGGDDDESGWLGRPGERLGEHLMVMVGRGVLDWTDDDTLVQRFFENATTKDAAHAIAFVGRSLRDETSPVPNEVVDRFRRFWEQLADTVPTDPPESIHILRPFGWWFASGRFDAEWAFGQLDRVINISGGIEPDFVVMERVADLAGEHPARCLAVLKALVLRDDRGWGVLGWKDTARIVLQVALAADATRSDAEALIHQIGARGHLEFRDLLSG
ncbi:MAG: hypothetical protein D6724_00975 [Armatimonadetes bacterium]|nr:MAG: hypothetical protein D6724_00975 [Armatimonadota bacterium]